MLEAYIRLEELGCKEASYCPKDGRFFIETGEDRLKDQDGTSSLTS